MTFLSKIVKQIKALLLMLPYFYCTFSVFHASTIKNPTGIYPLWKLKQYIFSPSVKIHFVCKLHGFCNVLSPEWEHIFIFNSKLSQQPCVERFVTPKVQLCCRYSVSIRLPSSEEMVVTSESQHHIWQEWAILSERITGDVKHIEAESRREMSTLSFISLCQLI